MKISLQKKRAKQLSPPKRKSKGFHNAYLQKEIQRFESFEAQSFVSSTEMLVSMSETQRFKIDFLVQSYEELITMFRCQRKEFIEVMKIQFERNLYYYSQIITLAKTYQQNTKKYLRSKLQDISNIFQLKISFFELKLKNTRKILFEDTNIDSFFVQKKNKIKKNHPQKGLEIGKTSSFQDGLDFDEQLKEIYSQKNFQISLTFRENEEIQKSLEKIKIELIKDWEVKKSQSVSFSSLSNPEQSKDTFKDISNEFWVENQDPSKFQFEKTTNQKPNFLKSSTKYPYCSNDTNTSAKQKPFYISSILNFKQKKNNQSDCDSFDIEIQIN